MHILRKIDLPPVWLVAFLAATWTIGKLWPMPGLRATGLAIAGFGLALILVAALQMWRARTTLIPRGQPNTLVSRGVFAMTRNPIYLGDALILVGMSLYWGALPGLVLALLFVLLISRRFIAGEEAALRQKFGQAFDDYCTRTRRWL